MDRAFSVCAQPSKQTHHGGTEARRETNALATRSRGRDEFTLTDFWGRILWHRHSCLYIRVII
jgi:hypothetical protein